MRKDGYSSFDCYLSGSGAWRIRSGFSVGVVREGLRSVEPSKIFCFSDEDDRFDLRKAERKGDIYDRRILDVERPV